LRDLSTILEGVTHKPGGTTTHDLAIIIVTIPGEPHWLTPCLRSLHAHVGDLELDVVVADNDASESTRVLVKEAFPGARVIPCSNRGFAYANNRGLMTCDARYVLFLNPDTEILEGSFEELVRTMDRRSELGLIGARQVTADGRLFPTIRWFPNALRALGDALGGERLPRRARWMGERELNWAKYDEETACDWTSGSFMLARREALESAGYLDERFFIYSEETDLCLRIKGAGWEIRHLPAMTILHHAQKAGISAKMTAQDVFTRIQYARKHFSPAHRAVYRAILVLRYLTRTMPIGVQGRERSAAARAALRVLCRIDGPPFGPPPQQALARREASPPPPELRSVTSSRG
jgi:N-acetylglucosaminyl-diphospho-decaprenol L-rhamnosyltransferase